MNNIKNFSYPGQSISPPVIVRHCIGKFFATWASISLLLAVLNSLSNRSRSVFDNWNWINYIQDFRIQTVKDRISFNIKQQMEWKKLTLPTQESLRHACFGQVSDEETSYVKLLLSTWKIVSQFLFNSITNCSICWIPGRWSISQISTIHQSIPTDYKPTHYENKQADESSSNGKSFSMRNTMCYLSIPFLRHKCSMNNLYSY
jgi:hypothetical protein